MQPGMLQHLDASVQEAPEPVGEDAGVWAYKNAHKCAPEHPIPCMQRCSIATLAVLSLQEQRQQRLTGTRASLSLADSNRLDTVKMQHTCSAVLGIHAA